MYSLVLPLTGTALSLSPGILFSKAIPSHMPNPGPSPETRVKQKSSASFSN